MNRALLIHLAQVLLTKLLSQVHGHASRDKSLLLCIDGAHSTNVRVEDLLNIVPSDLSMTEVLPDNLLDKSVNRARDLLHSLKEPHITNFAMLSSSHWICVKMIKD